MPKVVTFGELMVRLQPYNYERFVQADHLEFSFGGGEANVAVSLANYGLDAVYVTKLPAHAIGQAAVNSLRRYGVDTVAGRIRSECRPVAGCAHGYRVSAKRLPGFGRLGNMCLYSVLSAGRFPAQIMIRYAQS